MKQNYTMRRGALDGVEAFLATATRRSFRRAAADLGVTPSAVSQAVRALEGRVGAVLLYRTTRSVGLTEAGQRFLDRAGPAFDELVAAAGAARDLGQRPTGLLRICVPEGVISLVLEPMLVSFCKAHPEIEVEILVIDELVDLATTGFDAGVRLGELLGPDMVAVRLTAPFPFAVIGSPEYLAAAGTPEKPEELRHHACLRLRRSAAVIAPWRFVVGEKTIEALVSGPLIAHDYSTLVGAAARGLGLAQVPQPLAAAAIRENKLRTVLDSYAVVTPGVFLYHLGKRQVLPKLRAFIDHIKASVRL